MLELEHIQRGRVTHKETKTSDVNRYDGKRTGQGLSNNDKEKDTQDQRSKWWASKS